MIIRCALIVVLHNLLFLGFVDLRTWVRELVYLLQFSQYRFPHDAFKIYRRTHFLSPVIHHHCCESKILPQDIALFPLTAKTNKSPTVSLNAVKDGNLYHNNITSFTNVIPILGFNFSATASRDVASGLPTGHSTYTPITLYKEMDISSPLLMQILTTNEAFQAQITAVESATGEFCPPILVVSSAPRPLLIFGLWVADNS
jgi:hypothetical protein